MLGVSKQAAHKRFSGAAPSFERFSERARAVLSEARAQAGAFGQSLVGTEHLLLALFEPAEALAAKVLRDAGLNREVVEERLRNLAGAPADPQSKRHASRGPGYSPRALATLRHAVEEALKLGQSSVGTEHLLLGIFDDPDALANRLLNSLGTSYEDLRQRLAAELAALARSRSKGA